MDVKATIPTFSDIGSSAKIDQLTIDSTREKDISKVKQLASDFESIFLEQMLKSMRASVQKSGLVDGGNAEEIYTSMLDGEYAKQMGHQGGMGLADMIERQLLQTMGIKSAVSPSAVKLMAVQKYEHTSALPLRPEQKEVTIKPDIVPVIK